MLKEYINYLEEWIKEQVKIAHADGVIIGISGGIDSAVVASIAKKAFPNNHLGVYLPCYSSDIDLQSYEELVKSNKINSTIVDISKTFDTFIESVNNIELSKMAKANTKARIRMTTLYAIGQTKNYLVLGTDNAPEWYLGYFTKFGDGGVDLLPLIKLLKSDVREAAKLLNVPEIIINRPPTASLFEGQTDESELGFTYDEIDAFLIGKSVSKETREKIDRLHFVSEHKRKSAPMPKDFRKGQK